MPYQRDIFYMQKALTLAQQAADRDEVPVGAVLVDREGRVIGQGFNQTVGASDPSAHAEMVALRQAGQAMGSYRLPHTTLYVTLEPCPMCLGALMHARVRRIVYASTDPKTGACGGAINLVGSPCFHHHAIVSSGVLAQPAKVLLQSFFKKKRK